MSDPAALLFAIERGDPAAVEAFRDLLRAWRAGPLVALTGREYRRAKRDALLCELAALVSRADAGPATRAERALARLAAFRKDWPDLARVPRAELTESEAACLALAGLGEPIPRARMLRGVIAQRMATERARVAKTCAAGVEVAPVAAHTCGVHS